MQPPPPGGSSESSGSELFRRKRAIARYRIHRLNLELHLGLPPEFIWRIGREPLMKWDRLIEDVENAQVTAQRAIKDRYPFALHPPLLQRALDLFRKTLKELERAYATLR